MSSATFMPMPFSICSLFVGIVYVNTLQLSKVFTFHSFLVLFPSGENLREWIAFTRKKKTIINPNPFSFHAIVVIQLPQIQITQQEYHKLEERKTQIIFPQHQTQALNFAYGFITTFTQFVFYPTDQHSSVLCPVGGQYFFWTFHGSPRFSETFPYDQKILLIFLVYQH